MTLGILSGCLCRAPHIHETTRKKSGSAVLAMAMEKCGARGV